MEGETHDRGPSQNPTPLGCQCADCDSRLCFWVADLVAFINNDPLPPNVQQGWLGLLSLTRTLCSDFRTSTVVAHDSLVGGEYDVILSQFLCTKVSVSPVVSDISEGSRDAVFVDLRLPV